ncbi:MAG: two-component system response regulator MprA [Pseudoalteromonas tetraodonis]
MKLLIIEDYGPLRLSVAARLTEDGYKVDGTADGAEGLWMATENAYSLVLLDLTLPSMNGLDVLRKLRQKKPDLSVLITTAQDAIEDRVAGLDAGADDYLVKPFSLDELSARVRALVRRTHGQHDPVIRVGDLEIDTRTRSAKRAGAHLDLTAKEYALLELLAHRVGEIVARGDIWEQLYDFNQDVGSNVVDVFIAYLRKKTEAGGRPRLIHTRRGEGYVLAEKT